MDSVSNSRDSATTLSGSEAMMVRARKILAGGGNSTMRVLSYHLPLVVDRGEGSRVWDIDGKEYIDLNMAYGPLIFGHRPPHVIEAVVRQCQQQGSQLGFVAEVDIRVAEKLRQLYPGMERMRFSSTGTEAIASAVRLARVTTGRQKLILFEGHYHGWSDAVFHRYHALLSELPAAGHGPALPGTLGMNGAPHDVLVVPWNDFDALCACLEEHRGSVAAVMMEPVMGNGGVVPPQPKYLQAVREATVDHGALLIFDEVITGMRVAAGGAQELYQVYPDITVVSKALGGGFPIAAFGASRDLMEPIAEGRLFHGGVYSGNALVLAAAEAVLDYVLERPVAVYDHLHRVGDALAMGIGEILGRASVPHVVQNVGPMVSILLTHRDVDALVNYREVRAACDFAKYIRFQHELQRAGIYFHPNQFEPMFLSTAHTRSVIETVLERIEDAVPCCLVE